MGPGAKNLKINGLESKSPLANAALFSSECSNGKFLNLFEIMLESGLPAMGSGEKSNAELYADELNRRQVGTNVSHFHWWGSDPAVIAQHTQNVGMNPVDFTDNIQQSLTNYKTRMGSGQYQ
jgi:hypothetical protein